MDNENELCGPGAVQDGELLVGGLGKQREIVVERVENEEGLEEGDETTVVKVPTTHNHPPLSSTPAAPQYQKIELTDE